MALVYSVRFCAIEGLDGSAAFTVPEGFVWVLRDLDAWYVGFLSNTIHLTGSAGQAIWGNAFAGAEQPQYASWRGRQVLNTGESFGVNSAQATDITVSGYQLTLP